MATSIASLPPAVWPEIRLGTAGFLSQEQIDRVKDDFSVLDSDKDNKLAPADVGVLFQSLGQSITVEELSTILEPLPREGLTSDEFIFFFSRHYREPTEDTLLNALEDFNTLEDFDAADAGMLSVNKLRELITEMGEPLADEEADMVLRQADIQADGTLDYRWLVQRLGDTWQNNISVASPPADASHQSALATAFAGDVDRHRTEEVSADRKKAAALSFKDRAEEGDAASDAPEKGKKRPVWARMNTGFLTDLDYLDELRELLQGSNEGELDAESPITGGLKQDVRQQINTRLEEIQALQALQISNEVDKSDAAGEATAGLRRPLNQKVNAVDERLTEFDLIEECDTTEISSGQLAKRDSATRQQKPVMSSSPKGHLQFGDEVEELDASSKATAGPKRAARQQKGLNISDEVEELDAASKASGGPKQSTRKRINTGFEREAEPDVRKRGLQICDEVEELDAASKATGGPKPAVRQRINTGFEKQAPPDVPKRGLQISEEVEELDAASTATGGSNRGVRQRINTGFEKQATLDVPKRGLQISEEVEELDAASASTGGSKRGVRQRINTGFEKQAETDVPKRGLQISDKVEELDAASKATGGPKQSTRQRINTGFEREAAPDLPKRGLQISDDVEELDAASKATDGPKRAVRQRINTGFEKQATPDVPKRGLQISDEVEELDAASTATGGSKRGVRQRINTGFEKESDPNMTQRNLQISNEVEDLDAASVSPGRTVAKELTKKQRKPLAFSDEAEEVSAASTSTKNPKQVVGERISTRLENQEGHDEPLDLGVKFLQISDDVEQLDAASQATDGPKRTVRQRINTGFERQVAPDLVQKGLQISDKVEELDAASKATGGPKQSTRQRINTGFEREAETDLPKRGLQISDEVEELDAASKATAGPKRAARQRINTGFERQTIPDSLEKEVEPDMPKRGLQISNVVEELDAASKAADGPKRTARQRINTGFERQITPDFSEKEVDANLPRKGLQISEEVEELEAASTATDGPKRTARQRINTGFERQVSPDLLQKGLQISDNVEEFDAASQATSGPKQCVRQRINTGFEKDVEPDIPSVSSNGKEAGQQPDKSARLQGEISEGTTRKVLRWDDVEELDAASESPAGQRWSLRSRIATGFVGERDASQGNQQIVLMNDKVEELDAASGAASGPAASIRARIDTGFSNKAPEQGGRSLTIDGKVDEFDAASVNSSGPGRPVRARINTGFVRESDMGEDERLKISMNDKVDEVDAASVCASAGAASGQKRSVRLRVNTGFIRQDSMETTQSEKSAMDEKGEDSPQGDSRPSAVTMEEDRLSFNEGRDLRIHDKENHTSNVAGGFPKRQRKSARRTSVEIRRSLEEASTPSWFDALPEEGGLGAKQRDTAIHFAAEVDECDAASDAADSGTSRPIRARVNTGFLQDSQMPDEFEDAEADLTVSSMLSASRMSKKSLREEVDFSRIGGSIFDRANEKRLVQHAMIGLEHEHLTENSPELKIHDHKVEIYDKDVGLLEHSMKRIMLFEDLDNESMEDLVDAMEVFKFDEGEEVVRQGDLGGIYFFIVAEGVFEVVKDDIVVVELTVGATFGESVLLMNGSRMASVRAKPFNGSAIVYGMEADDVRDVLRFEYEKSHKEVMTAVDKIIESGSCEQLCKVLNAFQLHGLYTDSVVRSYENGEAIFVQGQEQLKEVYVLVQGVVVLQREGLDLARVPRFEMFGIEGLLFGDMEMTAVVDGKCKLLVLSRVVLEEVFEVEKMPTKLLQGRVHEQLLCMDELSEIHEGQEVLLSEAFTVRSIAPGEQLDTTDVCFVMGLHHEILVSTDGFVSDVQSHQGVDHPKLGIDNLLDLDLPWNIDVRAASAERPAFVAVWYASEVRNILAADEIKERLEILRMVWLFRTLSKHQLESFAEGMETEIYEADEAVFKQGDLGDAFYIIGSGRMHVSRNDRYIRGLGPGDYFGERALINKDMRSATIEASESSIIWKITHDHFHEIMPPVLVDYLASRMDLQDSELSFDEIWLLKVIGKGAFGVVSMVQSHKGQRFALKCVRKKQLVQLGCQSTVVNERNILHEIDHPFIIRLVQCFTNDAFVYLMLELVTGGELLDALTLLGVLNWEQTQFYTASILLAFEHLHENRIAYLDLKSENVLIDCQGYPKLVDFGLAVKISGSSYVVKGTPHFMAPEMILSKGYDTTADLWALGICVYEFMVGELPFGNNCTDKSAIFQAVVKGQLKFTDHFQQLPYADVSIKLMKGLLNRVPCQRLGGGMEGYKELLEHDFFKNFDFDALLGRKIHPPFLPKGEHYTEDKAEDQKRTRQNLAEVVEREVENELADGWEDPSPGWDDDFL